MDLEQIQELSVHSASGLVKFKNDFYVIADDDLSLHNITKNTSVALIAGKLPEDFKERKKVKPDWEALTLFEDGLLVIPSGSKENRRTGFLVSDISLPVDFSEVYIELEKTFPNLNIEGAFWSKNKLKLFQRGNGIDAKNAIITLDVFNEIKNSNPLTKESIVEISPYSLGQLGGITLGFTDACQTGNDIWFLAVAEDGDSTYEDGNFTGAVLGKIDDAGKFSVFELDASVKPEGLWVEDNKFYVVTDADDPNKKSVLYSGILPI